MRNWAGNLTYGARRLLEPESVEEVQELVRGSTSLRVLGSRHAFSSVADTTGDHLSLARLPRVIEIDPVAATVTVDGAIRYGDLAPVLHAAGFGAPQPGLAAAHLGGGRLRDRHPWVGRPERQPVHRRAGDGRRPSRR